jgi:hypothetical protein
MTDFGARVARPFGKRGSEANAGAPRPLAPANPTKLSSEEADSERERWYVPTKLAPILFAGVAVVVIQLLMGQILGLNGAMPPPGAPRRGFTQSDVATLFTAGSSILFLLAILIYQGCHLAALYAMPAHVVLRWLKFSSLPAYAIGGLCASFVFLSLAALQHDDQLGWETGAVELIGGALAGLFYRLFAGIKLRDPAPPSA